jgi:hypothetical protein
MAEMAAAAQSKSKVKMKPRRASMLSDEINETGAVAVPEGMNPPTFILSRNSAAEFFIRIIENKEYIREIVSVSNKPV